MVLYPSQQFGGQELATGSEVIAFAKGKDFEGTVLSIGDVVGPTASASWKMFYETTGAAEPT